MSDHRYEHVKSIWKAGDLKSFSTIFTIIPKSIISDDLGLNYGRFVPKIENPILLSMGDILRISKLTGVAFTALTQMVALEIEEKMTLKD